MLAHETVKGIYPEMILHELDTHIVSSSEAACNWNIFSIGCYFYTQNPARCRATIKKG